MFTICPKCALTLVVTAADLRVAQGHVRCGRCSSVFNALLRLTEERQGTSAEPASPLPPGPSLTDEPAPPLPPGPSLADEPSPEPQPAAFATEPAEPTEPTTPIDDAPTSPQDPAADADVIPEEALEFNPATTNAESVFVQPRPDPQWEAATGSFKAMVAANQEPVREGEADELVEVEIDSGFLAQIIKADALGATLAPAPPPASAAIADAPAHAPVSPAAPSQPAAARTKASRHAAVHARPALDADAHRRTVIEHAREGPEAEAPAERAPAEWLQVSPRVTPRERAPLAASADPEEDAGELAPRPPYEWIFGIAGAALLLLAQIVNHYRDDLAASARFNHPLTALYASLGVTLKPHWDLRAYDVRQLGASVDPANAGEITVRASIKNASPQPQPLPLLRVTLQDRFGNRIAARDVQPQFYVPGAVPAAALLGAGQRIDAEMAFLDPGANAVGFELDACLPASGGGVACANDAGPR
jgi:predicted Zn finger-like uncharacterized protein